MYDLNYKRLISWLIPSVFKSKLLPLILKCFYAPIEQAYIAFLQKKKDEEYKLSHNSQVCHLIKVLNDRFDLNERGIKITDIQKDQALYLYSKDEGISKTIFLGEKFIKAIADSVHKGVDFSVIIPERLKINQSEMYEMQSLINSYKLAGKRYKIVQN